ncbi:FAD-dependent monooxygenase [Nocardia sp. GCM10030253]|uniref:FAD-dependent monooxygenase n=1 Tax=Nocardia sp. GCM10030253 TaxID=3273404 RepID=UPI00363F987C
MVSTTGSFGDAAKNYEGERAVVDADVIIVGAGPAGLMLAGELHLAGVRPLVLERQPQPRDTPKAHGIGGQILELLRYRGLLERFRQATTDPLPAPRFPFGGVHLDFTQLDVSPMQAFPIPQARLERLLAERLGELGGDIRRGHEVVGLSQDGDTVTADVHGPEGPYQVTAGYLVGCDGSRSRVRNLAGIPFPGTSYPEVNRLATVTMPDSVTTFDNGDLNVPDVGRVRLGFNHLEGGTFALGPLVDGVVSFQTTEEEPIEVDDDVPLSMSELQDSIRRVLGVNLPLGEPLRLSRYQFQARQAERYRDGRIMLAGDAAHMLPATGTAINVGMQDVVNLAWKLAADVNGWAPAGLLDTYHDERHFAGERALLQTQSQVALRRGLDSAAEALRALLRELLVDEQPLRRMGALVGANVRYPLPGADQHALTGTFVPDLTLLTDQGTTSVAELMHTARPVFLDLADRPELREIAREWNDRVDIHTAKTEDRPADVLLIRPDAHIAWAATGDGPADAAALREALSCWFGAPLEAAVPGSERSS